MQKLPIKPGVSVINLGNFENLVEMTDKTITMGKTRNIDLCNHGLWLQREDGIYYFKSVKNMFLTLNDLLGVKITEYFGLPSVHYEVAKGNYNGQEVFGLLSKYERKEGYYYQNLEDIVYGENSKLNSIHNPSNLSILEILDEVYKGQPLSEQLKTLIVRDFVTNETDRKMGEIHIHEINGITSIDKIYDYEVEWNLLGEDTGETSIKEEDIGLEYKICGLLNLTEADYEYLRKDPVMQKALVKFMDLEISALLNMVETETPMLITSGDYEFYSQYAKMVKSKLKKYKIIS